MPWTHGLHRSVLPNGLTVLVQRHATAPVVAVVTHVRAGYFDEPDAWVGLSHVLEHMFFKGTPRFGPGALARETQRLGGYVNAGTIYDKTVYYAVAPSAADGLAHIAELQSDALRHLLLDPEELAREREVIVQEARRKLDSPGAVTGESLYAELFKRHRMGRWRMGKPEQIRRLTAEDLRTYYRTRYVPERVIVSLVGDLDPERALALAERLWGDWSAPVAEVEGSPEEPPGRPGTLSVLRGDVARPIAAFGWRTIGALHPDTPALDVAADVLSSGRTAWLDRGVRDTGLAASVGAGHHTPLDLGVFELSLTADATTLSDALGRALGTVRLLARTGPTEDDLLRVRALHRTRWARRLEAAEGRATAFAEFEALGGYAELDVYLDRVLSIDAHTVRRAAATWLQDVPAGVIYLPTNHAAGWEESVWPPRAVEELLPSIAPVPPAPRRSAPHAPTRAVPGGVRHRVVPGGDLLARRQAGSGLVSLALLAEGIRLEETMATAGLTQLMVRGALRADGGRLAAAAERIGGAFGAVSTLEAAGWTVSVPPDCVDEAIGFLVAVGRSAEFDPAGVAVEARLQADRAAALRDDMYRYPMQRVLAAAFGDDPYALPPLGEPDQVRTFDVVQVREWYARWRARPALVVAVGDAEEGLLLDALEGAAGTWDSATAPRMLAPPAWQAGRLVESRDRQQSALAMAFPAPAADDARRHALTVVGAVLSGMAGRLFEELRERRSLAYTVQAAPWLRHRTGAVLTYIATTPDHVNEARDAMLAELDRLMREPVGSEELERARQYAAGLAVLQSVHTVAVRDAVVDGWLTGTLADLTEGPDRLRAVTSDAVLAVAASVFPPDRRAEFVLASG